MTFFEWYSLAAPFILLAVGVVIFFYAKWESDRSKRRIQELKHHYRRAAE